jgi:hypothetical protein
LRHASGKYQSTLGIGGLLPPASWVNSLRAMNTRRETRTSEPSYTTRRSGARARRRANTFRLDRACTTFSPPPLPIPSNTGPRSTRQTDPPRRMEAERRNRCCGISSSGPIQAPPGRWRRVPSGFAEQRKFVVGVRVIDARPRYDRMRHTLAFVSLRGVARVSPSAL